MLEKEEVDIVESGTESVFHCHSFLSASVPPTLDDRRHRCDWRVATLAKQSNDKQKPDFFLFAKASLD